MSKPHGYITREDRRADVAALIADYLANGGQVHRFTTDGKAL